mgnify:CR=1 FL=1|tara:strand:- start:407 stop:571 length:165 start_codon:yes stop_codon:yes gene_type:complete
MDFDTWAENYTEMILEELGEHAGQAHLDMLTTDDLLDIMDNQSALDKELTNDRR